MARRALREVGGFGNRRQESLTCNASRTQIRDRTCRLPPFFRSRWAWNWLKLRGRRLERRNLAASIVPSQAKRMKAMRVVAAASASPLAGCSPFHHGFLAAAGPVADHERHFFVIVCIVMLFVIGPVLLLTPVFAWHYRLANTKSAYRPQWSFSQRAAYHRLSVRADARRSLRAFPGSVADSGNRCLGSGRDSDIGTSHSKQEFRPRSSPDEMHDVSNSGIADQLRIAFEEPLIASGM